MPAGLADLFTNALLFERHRVLVKPRVIPLPAPGAGVDWTTTVTPGTVWFPQTVLGTFTASAVVANRFVLLTVSDGTTQIVRVPLGSTFTASQVGRAHWLRMIGTQYQANIATANVAPLPVIPLVGGLTLAASTVALDVGDAWTNVALYVLELRERQPDELVRYVRDILNGARTDPYPGILSGL